MKIAYKVEEFPVELSTSGTLELLLNALAKDHWRLCNTIQAEKEVWLILEKELA